MGDQLVKFFGFFLILISIGCVDVAVESTNPENNKIPMCSLKLNPYPDSSGTVARTILNGDKSAQNFMLENFGTLLTIQLDIDTTNLTSLTLTLESGFLSPEAGNLIESITLTDDMGVSGRQTLTFEFSDDVILSPGVWYTFIIEGAGGDFDLYTDNSTNSILGWSWDYVSSGPWAQSNGELYFDLNLNMVCGTTNKFDDP